MVTLQNNNKSDSKQIVFQNEHIRMTVLKSSEVFYLDFKHLEDHHDLSICSSTSRTKTKINKLFLVSLSPMLKGILTEIDAKIDDPIFTLITDYDQVELDFLVKFCANGTFPVPYQDLQKNEAICNLFKAFGIDLNNLFSQNEQDIKDVKPEIEPMIHEDDFIFNDTNGFDSEEEDENKPLSLKRKIPNRKKNSVKPKRRKVSNGEAKTKQSSQLLTKHDNYVQIQEKYKDYLNITIPQLKSAINMNKNQKFSDYEPIQPLESHWKPPRPPSRKKKMPKGYEKYPLKCDQCPKRFTSEILRSFHMKVYHSPHFQCPYCPNAYHEDEKTKFKKHLYNHEHITKTSKPHECIQCGKQDFCLQRLIKHVDTFRGPFHNSQCTQCSMKFSNYPEHKKHVEESHGGVWKYRCDDCELVFDTLHESKEHRLEAHKRKQPPKHTVPTMCDVS